MLLEGPPNPPPQGCSSKARFGAPSGAGVSPTLGLRQPEGFALGTELGAAPQPFAALAVLAALAALAKGVILGK